MNCPLCAIELVLAEKQGIEIDYCPRCRGVWLDRGELDKIVERSVALASHGYGEERRSPHAPSAPPAYHSDRTGHHGHGKHRRKSFLQELFDFD